jgi:O-antigen/teichoic acid export membrane protein
MIKNLSYSFLSFFVSNIFPVITFPIACRNIGPEDWGVYNYVNNIIILLTLLSSFGINIYGVQKIGEKQGNKLEQQNFLRNSVRLNILLSILCYVFVFIITLNISNQTENNLFRILGIIPILNALSIEWYFIGIENNKALFQRNIISKTILLVMVLLLLQGDFQSEKYAFFLVIAQFINVLFSVRYLKSIFVIDNFDLVISSISQLFKKLKSTFIFEVLYRLFGISDLIILGFYLPKNKIGLYSFASTLILVLMSLLKSINIVVLPRISSMKYKGDLLNIRTLNIIILEIFCFIGFLMVFTILNFNKEIIYLIGGSEFAKSNIYLTLMSPIIIFSVIVNFLIFQILIPYNKIKPIRLVFTVMIIFNLLLNILLIPTYGIFANILVSIFTQAIMVLIFYSLSPKEAIQLPNLINLSLYIITLYLLNILDDVIIKSMIIHWHYRLIIYSFVFLFLGVILNANKIKTWKTQFSL